MFDPKTDPATAVKLIALDNRLNNLRGDLDKFDKEARWIDGQRRIILNRILATRRETTRLEKGETNLG